MNMRRGCSKSAASIIGWTSNCELIGGRQARRSGSSRVWDTRDGAEHTEGARQRTLGNSSSQARHNSCLLYTSPSPRD